MASGRTAELHMRHVHDQGPRLSLARQSTKSRAAHSFAGVYKQMTRHNMLIMSSALERWQIQSWKGSWNHQLPAETSAPNRLISVTKTNLIFFYLFLGLYTGCSAVNTVLPGLDRLLKVHNERGREQLSGHPAPSLLVLFTADFLLGPVPACLSSQSKQPFQNKCHSSCKEK